MIPVFLDLDRTLIRHSTSNLEFQQYLKVNGFSSTASTIFHNKLFNRLKLKTWISNQPLSIDYSREFNSEVISLVRKFELSGAPIILATASPRASVERVLAQCPLKFQHIITSSHSKNIKGAKKLTEIQKYLESHTSPNFIYIGDTIADLKIMKNATESIFVGKKMVYLVGRHLIQISGLERVKIERPKERGRLK